MTLEQIRISELEAMHAADESAYKEHRGMCAQCNSAINHRQISNLCPRGKKRRALKLESAAKLRAAKAESKLPYPGQLLLFTADEMD